MSGSATGMHTCSFMKKQMRLLKHQGLQERLQISFHLESLIGIYHLLIGIFNFTFTVSLLYV